MIPRFEILVIISRTNVASVGSVFNHTRKVKVLSLPETIKEKSTFRAKALRRESVVGGRGKPRVFLYELINSHKNTRDFSTLCGQKLNLILANQKIEFTVQKRVFQPCVLGKTNEKINNRNNLTFFIAALTTKTSVAQKI